MVGIQAVMNTWEEIDIFNGDQSSPGYETTDLFVEHPVNLTDQFGSEL